MQAYKVERMNQFNQMVQMSKKLNDSKVVFGGDFNMRDAELKRVNDRMYFSKNIQDCWIADGRNPDSQFTWDLGKLSVRHPRNKNFITELNDNKVLPFKARCRFDRLYVNEKVKSTSFQLEGTKKLKNDIDKFISDHFGISVTLE